MRKRDIQIIVHLNNDERERLRTRVKKSGLSQEAYIRHLINGYVPTDLPPPDYHAMMNELRAIGANMKQITLSAHVLNAADARKYDEAFEMLKQSLVEIVDAVTRPRKITGLPYGTMVLREDGRHGHGSEDGFCRAVEDRGLSESWP